MANLDINKMQPISIGDDKNIYIEKFEARRSDLIRVCDSLGKPFYTFSVNTLSVRMGKTTPIQVYQAEYERLVKLFSIEGLAKALTIDGDPRDYSVVNDWTDFIEMIYGDKAYITEEGQWIDTRDGSEIFEADMLKQSGVFKVGAYYIWVRDLSDGILV